MGIRFWSGVEKTSHLDRLFSDVLEIADYILRLPVLHSDNIPIMTGALTLCRHETCPKLYIPFFSPVEGTG